MGDAARFETTESGLKPINSNKVDSRRFKSYCPGVGVSTPRLPRKKLKLGNYLAAYLCYAADSDIRFHGASGGALTAINSQIIQDGGKAVVTPGLGIGYPRARIVDNPKDLQASQGSQYRETLFIPANELLTLTEADSLVVRPCQASALTQAGHTKSLLLSFYCAGIPRNQGLKRLLDHISIKQQTKVQLIRFRGRGWPGSFEVEAVDGSKSNLSYEESWGGFLGRELLLRCTLCPDAIGDSADIVAADPWRIVNGRPSFEEGPGLTAIFIRSQKGLEIFNRSIEDGNLVAISSLDVESFKLAQEYQMKRRSSSLLRLSAFLLLRGKFFWASGYTTSLFILNPYDGAKEFLRAIRKYSRKSK
jgi:coenzyme F420 hydrogenase subunit beta